jgi:glycosyltransferase involved in cell wall biosynthesis
LDDSCRRHGVEDQVLRTGWQPPEVVREIFGWSTAQIIHSEHETQCMALYEGLAAGVPGLISDIPALTSAFPALPRHATEEQLANNLATLLATPEQGAQLVAACADRVAWADVARHDRVFYETMSRLVGRPVRATST